MAIAASLMYCTIRSTHLARTSRMESRGPVAKNSAVHSRRSVRQWAPYWAVMREPSFPMSPFMDSYIFLPARTASWFLNMTRAASLEEITTVVMEPRWSVIMGPCCLASSANNWWGAVALPANWNMFPTTGQGRGPGGSCPSSSIRRCLRSVTTAHAAHISRAKTIPAIS